MRSMNRATSPKVAWLLLGGSLLLGGCGDTAKVVSPAGGKQVIANLVSGIAQPRAASLAQQATRLASAVDSLCTEPDTQRLAQARDAWRAVNADWQAAQPLLFGVARELNLKRRLGQWPTHESVMQVIVNADTEPGVRVDASVRGVAGMEMLLFDAPDSSDVEPWRSVPRCSHSRDVAAEIAALAQRLDSAWQGDYANRLTVMGQDKVLSMLLAETLNATEALLWQRLGVPSNFFRGDAQPHMLEAWRSEQSLQGVKATLDGLARVLGDDRAGVANLLVAQHPKVARLLSEAVAATLDAADRIPPPLHRTMLRDASRVERLFDRIQDLKSAQLEAAYVLGLSVQFEEDGD